MWWLIGNLPNKSIKSQEFHLLIFQSWSKLSFPFNVHMMTNRPLKSTSLNVTSITQWAGSDSNCVKWACWLPALKKLNFPINQIKQFKDAFLCGWTNFMMRTPLKNTFSIISLGLRTIIWTIWPSNTNFYKFVLRVLWLWLLLFPQSTLWSCF